MKLTQAFITFCEAIHRDTGMHADLAIKNIELDERAFDSLVGEHLANFRTGVDATWREPTGVASVVGVFDVAASAVPTLTINGVRFTRRPR